MRDRLGNELSIGDTVVYATYSLKRLHMEVGNIMKITNKMVGVSVKPMNPKYAETMRMVKQELVVIINKAN